ncbi:hypothetical protein ACFWHQ_32630 [Streptomyces sp. NPDC060334]|uniref:hypothetical protein n=1 Tax=unclassified Streptomyces TaxID=2593676 RepID=UPI00364CE2C6
MVERTRRKDRTEVTFVLPADAPPGSVGVVGDFNDWRPGVHTLTPRKDGNRAVTVALPSASAHFFRYLAAGVYWFSVGTAEAQDGADGRLHA